MALHVLARVGARLQMKKNSGMGGADQHKLAGVITVWRVVVSSSPVAGKTCREWQITPRVRVTVNRGLLLNEPSDQHAQHTPRIVLLKPRRLVCWVSFSMQYSVSYSTCKNSQA